MKPAIAVLALAATTFAFPAAAQMSMSAAYIGGSIGQSKFKDACSGTGSGVSCDDKDTAWRILGGYQFNPNFAAELGYHDFGEAKASAAGVSASAKSKAWELVGVGMLPFANQFGAYGKLGGYRATSDLSSNIGGGGSDTNTGLTYGAGLQWNPTLPLGLRLEWQRYHNVGGDNTGGKDDIDVLSLGALWRFR